MKNVMLDLETWGTTPGSAIRSIGAVLFDPHGNTLGDEFYVNVTRESCVELGLGIDPNTEAWWGRQVKAAQDALLVEPQHVVDAVGEFVAWWRKNRAIFVWSQGGNFDEPLMTAVMRATGHAVPWKFWDARCTRTAYDMGMLNTRTIKREGTHHNALEDAKHQARCVQMAYAK